MKARMVSALITAVIAIGASAADIVELPEKGDWKNDEGLTAKPEDILEYTGKEIHATEKLKIDTSKITKVSCEFRKLEPVDKTTLLIGFWVWDKDNRQITPRNVATVANTNTELVSPSTKEATSVKVKDGTNIKTNMVMAFNAADDNKSDLPNFNVSHGMVKTVEKQDDGWLVTFTGVVNQEFPAGTKVRMHNSWGGYLYVVIATPAMEFKKYEGLIQGEKWWPGTVAAEPVMLMNKKCKSEFKNFKIEFLDK